MKMLWAVARQKLSPHTRSQSITALDPNVDLVVVGGGGDKQVRSESGR